MIVEISPLELSTKRDLDRAARIRIDAACRSRIALPLDLHRLDQPLQVHAVIAPARIEPRSGRCSRCRTGSPRRSPAGRAARGSLSVADASGRSGARTRFRCRQAARPSRRDLLREQVAWSRRLGHVRRIPGRVAALLLVESRHTDLLAARRRGRRRLCRGGRPAESAGRSGRAASDARSRPGSTGCPCVPRGRACRCGHSGSASPGRPAGCGR